MERSVLGSNMNLDLKIMSAIDRSVIKCALYRGFAMSFGQSFHAFLRKVFVVERCPLSSCPKHLQNTRRVLIVEVE